MYAVILMTLCDVSGSYMFVALMLYGWAVIPFVYVQSFLCNVASDAYVVVTEANIFLSTYSLLLFIILMFSYCKHIIKQDISRQGRLYGGKLAQREEEFYPQGGGENFPRYMGHKINYR